MKNYFLITVMLILSASAFAQTEIVEPVPNDENLPQTNKNLLPDAPDAWVLQIVTTGGFSGTGLPTVTIKSDGNFDCGETTPSQPKKIEVEKLKTLAESVTMASFKITDALVRTEKSNAFVCSDCYQTKIYLTRREEKNEINFYSNTPKLLKYTQFVDRFNSIQQNALEFTACQR